MMEGAAEQARLYSGAVQPGKLGSTAAAVMGCATAPAPL
jgi:hypothetical protein